MIVLLLSRKMKGLESLRIIVIECLGKNLILMIVILFNSISTVLLSNCPLLRSFINDTGILIFNKTAMMNAESIIHCQWLVVGSLHQVIKILIVTFNLMFKFLNSIAYCCRIRLCIYSCSY